VGPTGLFPTTPLATASPEDILHEWNAQLTRGRSLGVTAAFLEFGGPATPSVQEALRRLSEAQGLPVRADGWGFNVVPVVEDQAARIGSLRDYLTTAAPGIHLWQARPAHASPETWGLWPDDDTASCCDADARAVCEAELIALVRQRGIALLTFCQAVELRMQTDAKNK
jgi:hypothetical protein